MGISPHRWQMNLRVLEAQEMLRDGKRSQADVALATGFAEQSHFSRVFKEVVGVPPGVWQRAHRQ
jgi:transcriptional regulator GlxA family with amidase domain